MNDSPTQLDAIPAWLTTHLSLIEVKPVHAFLQLVFGARLRETDELFESLFALGVTTEYLESKTKRITKHSGSCSTQKSWRVKLSQTKDKADAELALANIGRDLYRLLVRYAQGHCMLSKDHIVLHIGGGNNANTAIGNSLAGAQTLGRQTRPTFMEPPCAN